MKVIAGSIIIDLNKETQDKNTKKCSVGAKRPSYHYTSDYYYSRNNFVELEELIKCQSR